MDVFDIELYGVDDKAASKPFSSYNSCGCTQEMRGGAHHENQRANRCALLAIVDEQLHGAGGPLSDVYITDLEHAVHGDDMVLTANSTFVTKSRSMKWFRR